MLTQWHNIIQIQNNILWDWRYFAEYSDIQYEYKEYPIEYY